MHAALEVGISQDLRSLCKICTVGESIVHVLALLTRMRVHAPPEVSAVQILALLVEYVRTCITDALSSVMHCTVDKIYEIMHNCCR